ncbi:MAG TPA: SDR family oxidoreductase [Solirubrobacterales bacterium]|nr:SDR family oxidoreductase [Solirubrobacterales bacterium]
MGEDAGPGCLRTPEERFELHADHGRKSGLGRAIAFGLAAAGADVAIASRRIQMGREVAAEIVYAAFGKLDVLVNNAGKSPLYSSVEEIDEGYWDGVLGLNLKGPFRLAALVGSRMAAGEGGSIINVSSVAARHPRPDSAPYSAAKAGLEAIMVALAHTWGPKVRVNAIQPGTFLTDISRASDMDAFGRRAERFAARRLPDRQHPDRPQEISPSKSAMNSSSHGPWPEEFICDSGPTPAKQSQPRTSDGATGVKPANVTSRIEIRL